MFLAIVLLALGLVLGVGGAKLALLGGSFYYLVTGICLAATAVLVWLRKPLAVWVYAATTGGTMLWAIYESGLDTWALMPRVLGPVSLGLWFALPAVRYRLGTNPLGAAVNPVVFASGIALLVLSYFSQAFDPVTAIERPSRNHAGDEPRSTSWTHFGSNAGGQRFVKATQINKANVHKLELAWSYRISGDSPTATSELSSGAVESTPIVVDGRLYFCTSTNIAIALDAESGTELWRYDPNVAVDAAPHKVCRGVSYHQSIDSPGSCPTRLLMGSLDNRLIAIDAASGQPCLEFGDDGVVNLSAGIGEPMPGYNYVTSPPTIVNGVVIVGSFIMDNQSTNEPPGVVRGFDVITGEMKWAWDVLGPVAHHTLPDRDTYPRNTPNVWSVGSADAELGLVYLPTGNTPPDFYGGHRTPEQDRYPSSVVALDVQTGNVRWSFQTVTHDIWDFDIAAQPVLVDWDTPQGKRPGLIVPTKRGEIFILDRRSGGPLTAVEEKPVPQNPAKGEWLSPTQPFSVGFPSFAPPDLTEASMWGATPVDQLWCRLQFKSLRYEGQFTPHSTQGTITYPGIFGVLNWGSVSLDPERGVMVVNTSYLPWFQQLIERSEADRLNITPFESTSKEAGPIHSGPEVYYAQAGTPYATDSRPFLSPLGFPCHQPPWGELAAVDLVSREIMWRRPLGTTRDHAPLGIPLPTGVFNMGGSVTTRSGLTFIAATIDNYLRAFDVDTGRALWKARLPAGGQSNAISYLSERNGRQYVVIAAGGHAPMLTTPGDYILAYALPDEELKL